MKRQGVVLLEFANVLEGSGTAPGERRYDWQNKQVSTGGEYSAPKMHSWSLQAVTK